MTKTVLITGASRGIGFALTQQFITNGYNVIGTSRTGKITNLTHKNFEVLKLEVKRGFYFSTFSQIDKTNKDLINAFNSFIVQVD